MAKRSWRWLRVRITGLLSRPSSFLVLDMGADVIAVPSTRFGLALNPPNIGS